MKLISSNLMHRALPDLSHRFSIAMQQFFTVLGSVHYLPQNADIALIILGAFRSSCECFQPPLFRQSLAY